MQTQQIVTNGSGTPRGESLEEKIARLEAENAKLKAAAITKTKLSLKVGEKGGLSVYGLGRFPVTLYKEQWKRLFASKGEIEQFMSEHDHELKAKE